jgi:hypothetical protein
MTFLEKCMTESLPDFTPAPDSSYDWKILSQDFVLNGANMSGMLIVFDGLLLSMNNPK